MAKTPPAARPRRPLRPYCGWRPTRDESSNSEEEGTDPRDGTSALRDLGTVLLIFLSWRGLLFGFDLLGRSVVQPSPQLIRLIASSRYWDGWVHWDGYWYHTIAESGYAFSAGSWAFFPLFPYTTRALAATGLVGSLWAAGLLLSNLVLVGALFYLLRIGRCFLDEDGVRRFLVYLLIYPSSFFLSAYYSEGVFLFVTSASVYHYLRGQYARCGLWGALATLARPMGLMLVPALALGHLWDRRGRPSRKDLGLLWLGLVPCGLLLFMLWAAYWVGDPLAFSHAQRFWHRSFTLPPVTLVREFRTLSWVFPGDPHAMVKMLDLFSSLLFLALPFGLLRGVPKALPLYALLLILMPLATGRVLSMLRLEVVAFPAFLTLAKLGAHRRLDRLFIAASSLFLGLFKLAFASGFFVG